MQQIAQALFAAGVVVRYQGESGSSNHHPDTEDLVFRLQHLIFPQKDCVTAQHHEGGGDRVRKTQTHDDIGEENDRQYRHLNVG
jgi:hypothetical protein